MRWYPRSEQGDFCRNFAAAAEEWGEDFHGASRIQLRQEAVLRTFERGLRGGFAGREIG